MFILQNIKFKDILAIDELEIPKDKVSCVIGPSGAGKSTLLKLINNMLSVDQGQILYKRKNVEEISPMDLRREVMMLPQKPIMFAGTIKDNLEIAFKLLEEDVPQEQVLKEVLKKVQLHKELDIQAERLSGGEKQRLSLARVLLLQPEVLLLDEPSSALDENTENLIIEMVVEYVKGNQKTLVMITHSKQIAKEYGDKVIILKNGKVVNEVKS